MVELNSNGSLNCHQTNGVNPVSNGFNAIKKSEIIINDSEKDNNSDKNRKTRTCRQDPPLHILFFCYLSYLILVLFGYLRDFLRRTGIEKNKAAVEANREGYVPLFRTFERFYGVNFYKRACHGFSQPIAGVPGGIVQVLDRETDDYNWTFRYTGITYNAINLGSYNYLGFAQNNGVVADRVHDNILKYGIGVATTHHEIGKLDIHLELEELFTKFLGVESSIIFGMGFATNSTNIPTLAGKRCLIYGDQLNHASLKFGSYLSGATYKPFLHNDMKDLETKLRNAIAFGDPRTRRPWKKIIIIVEGVYSMEGTIANLPELIRLKKKYKCYLYVDEAHSIGAIGPKGKGIVDYYGCDPNDVDLLMGTLTKSFGAAGGYIAGRKEIIDHIRIYTHSTYATNMSPPVVQQIISVLKVLLGDEGGTDGQMRIKTLARNTSYFRRRLQALGFTVNGQNDSPVIPIMIYFPAKIPAFVRLGVTKGIATVGAGYPATSIPTCRMRFCMSSSHDKQMLDKALDVISEIGDSFSVKYSKRHNERVEDIIY